MSGREAPADVILRWRFTAVRGYFSLDDDPADWGFRATTQHGLGLLERTYDSDSAMDDFEALTQWQRFVHHLEQLNRLDTSRTRYKLLYLVRHGQGVHNLKEREVGRKAWEETWAKQDCDDTSTWADAELTDVGVEQAQSLGDFLVDEYKTSKLAPPETVYSSPLRRCISTAQYAFASLLGESNASHPAKIHELLRERLGVHTCDRRSTKSWIQRHHPDFHISEPFTEDDMLWSPTNRETLQEHIARSTLLLDDIFEQDNSSIIALVAHSGTLMSLFGATGFQQVPVAAGALIPLLIRADRIT